MFENEQDTGLLHNSLLSVVKCIQSKESDIERKFDLEDEDDAVTVIASTINSLTRGVRKNSVEETLNKQLHLQRRCHAAIFFTVLKSNGISCAEASKYYESIAFTFPTLSWKFYMKLNFHCKWSEYFVECSQELERDILSIVLKKILCIEWNEEKHMICYSWHTVLQAIIWKFFIIEDSTLSPSLDSCTFAFPFVLSHVKPGPSCSIFDKNKDCFTKSHLLHSFVTLLNHLQSDLASSFDRFDFIKIIFHAYKTIFRLLSEVKTCEKNVVKELFRLNKLIENCYTEKQSLDVIEAVLKQKSDHIPLSHYYALTSWEISGNYLIFLLCNYWDDILEMMSEGTNTSCFSLKEFLPQSNGKEIFRNLSPFFKTKFEIDDSNYLLSLKIIITLQYPCATEAAVILMRHPEVRESDDVLTILEGNVLKLNTLKIYPILADAIATSQFKNAKIKLSNLFFKILAELSGNIYNDALEYILSNYCANNHFLLDDFNDQLNFFTRKMMSNDEAKKCLLPLFIQSPKNVLRMLIEQALLRGSNEVAVIKVLQHIPIACLHSNSLVEELKPYFIKNETVVKEMTNMPGLIESLMKIHAETPIIDFDIFLQNIITPNLAAGKKVSYTLECLNASLNVLVPRKDWKIETQTLSLLIQCLSSVIDKCIKLGDGRVKELAVTTLSLLSNSQGKMDTLKTELRDNLASYSPSVLVYISKLFGETFYQELNYCESKLHDHLWILCCNFKDENLFQKNILEKKLHYEDLISVIVSVLPHLTKEEWFESAHLIREYLQYSNIEVSSTIPWLLPKSNPHSYTIIRCLIDSYYFTIQKGVYDLCHLSNCFTNTMQRILIQEVNLDLCLNVFMDVCHLTLNNKDEVYTSLLPFLLTVKKSIEDQCTDKQLKKIYLNLLHHGIKGLPNYEENLPFFYRSSVKI